MEDFELLRYVTIGQYLPGESVVHRLDPRTKLTVFLLLTLVASFSLSYSANLILLAVTLALVLVSQIPLGYIFSGIKPALPLIVILAILQLLFYGDAYVPYGMATVTLFEWGWIHITNGSVQLVIVSMLRFVELLFLTSLLTNTTPLNELTHGIASMLQPFARFGLPAHELSLVGTIALRFVPLLAEQLEIIMKAQASRGATTAQQGKLRFVNTARQAAVLIVPLFVDAFRRGEDLILAMQARCYAGGRGRSNYVRLNLATVDYVVMVLGLLFTTVMLGLRNRFPI
jgi:energy-coupling factor transport system permease protein